jgi:hypothetical protein
VSTCRCAIDEARRDRDAEAWAQEHGTKLEREDRKLGLCGDRFVSFEQRRSLVERILDAQVLRDYRERVRLRRETIGATMAHLRSEEERLRLHEEILDLHFDQGLKGEEIAVRFGRNSHSWTSERLTEIRAAAMSNTPGVGYVGRPCKRPDCPNEVERVNLKRGRRPEYCSRKCAVQHANDRRPRRGLAAGVTHMIVTGISVVGGAPLEKSSMRMPPDRAGGLDPSDTSSGAEKVLNENHPPPVVAGAE